MNNIKILDCTLRDGGYINDWKFCRNTIKGIIKNLVSANVDIIETGFIRNVEHDTNSSVFTSIDDIKGYITPKKKNVLYAVMIEYHNHVEDQIAPYDGSSADIIRVSFRKNEWEGTKIVAKELMSKGYKVCIQPVGTATYDYQSLLNLLRDVNDIKPYAFYLVDTLGTLYKDELMRLAYLIDGNLNSDIMLGFHSHNNLQLSFSNAQDFIQVSSNRDIIIDSSIFGMGRGAGNLCTELITQYINENIENKYDIIPILEAMDEYIMPIYSQHPWGYSAPYYIAATNNCHPNYATFLMNKETLCIRDINTIIKSIPDENKHLYSDDLISKMYLDYQQKSVDDSLLLNNLSTLCSGQVVLIIAPGRSAAIYEKKILEFIEKEKPFVFAVNHIPKHLKYDKVFVSNLKRFKGIDDAIEKLGSKLICTSNIVGVNSSQKLNYSTYLNDDEIILDNAGLMLINVLRKAGVKKIYLAGYDGFSYSEKSNYCDEKLINQVKYERRTELNAAMKKYFERVRKNIEIEFITPSIYNSGENNE